MRIGVDVMGSDSAPAVLFEAVLLAAEQLAADDLLVVFCTPAVAAELSANSASNAKISFQTAPETVNVDDDPIAAVTRKKNSTLALAMQQLAARELDAFVYAGNTGALVVAARLFLDMLPGINRPALLATLPTKTGSVAVIDVGGNVSCKPLHLVQFAFMGAAYQSCCHDVATPSVGLLNIGIESMKGTPEVREAYQKLLEMAEKQNKKIPLRFVGNIEGREVFQGRADVLVTDGFSGNVLLKTAEGMSDYLFDELSNGIALQWGEAVAGDLDTFRKRFSYAEYPGAALCGVDGVVIKCHGHSSVPAMYNGILGAARLVNTQFVFRIKDLLSSYCI